jgi:hypothetical protein
MLQRRQNQSSSTERHAFSNVHLKALPRGTRGARRPNWLFRTAPNFFRYAQFQLSRRD